MTTDKRTGVMRQAHHAPAGHTFQPGDFDSVIGATAVFSIAGHPQHVGTIIRADITEDGQAVTFTYEMH